MNIRLTQTNDDPELIQLIAGFRQSLAQLRNKDAKLNLESAKNELFEYREREFPIFVSETEQEKIIGYLVCRVDGNVVWAESLFVLPEHRRGGVGSALYEEAEKIARELGNETLYNWIDPNNTKIINFLQKRGYNVLNLIELRRPRTGEVLESRIQVGHHEFQYY